MLEHPKTRPTDKVKMDEMSASEMGNQQERLDAARIAMLLDTDGWVSIRVLQRSKVRVANLTPYCGAVNTSPELMEWAADAMTRLGIPRYVQHVNVAKYEYAKGNKAQIRVLVNGLRRVQSLLKLVTPYLVAKQKQAILLMEFIESRLAASLKAAYTERELQLANEIRALNSNKGGNFRPISSETVRAAQEMKSMLNGMIQSDLTRDRESTAEMTVPVL